MDAIHPHFIRPDAFGPPAYVQLPDIASANVTDVLKPQKNGEETASMFDKEHEDVELVIESETLSTRLLARTKETGMDHQILETLEAKSSLHVSSDWELETSGKDRVLPGSSVPVDLVAKFRWKFLEWKGTVWLISKCFGVANVLLSGILTDSRRAPSGAKPSWLCYPSGEDGGEGGDA